MCGRFVCLTYDEVLGVAQAVAARMGAQADADWPAVRPLGPSGSEGRTEARPGAAAFTLLHRRRDNSDEAWPDIDIAELTWGFKKPWETSGKSGLVYNTRIESLGTESGMWASMTNTGRCVVPVAGFYELHATERVAGGANGRSLKRPYLFTSDSGLPLLLAGVSDQERFSIVTTRPNAQVAPVHDRMPVALSVREAGEWMDPRSDVRPMLEAFAERAAIRLETVPQGKPIPTVDQLSLF